MDNGTIFINNIGHNIYALVENGKIAEIKIAIAQGVTSTKNISGTKIGQHYCARIKTIDLRLNAAFIDLGTEQALLPFKGKRPAYITEGKAILVEISRAAFGEKLATASYIGDAKANTPCPSIIQDVTEWGEWPEPTQANDEQINLIEDILQGLDNNTFSLINGGNICIEPTRAMITIDVDAAGRIAGGTNQLNFNHKLNRDAATKAAQLIRLLNLSGLIVIDFVGAPFGDSARELNDILRNILAKGHKTEILPISKFGICEISRARKGISLIDLYNNRPLWIALSALNKLAKSLMVAKGKVVELNINHDAAKFLTEWGFDWKTYINEKIGGRYIINATDIKGFEVI